MKKFNFILAITALIAMFSVSMASKLPDSYQGEPPNELEMITSLSRLTTYALENVRFGYKSIWSSHMIHGLGDKSSCFANGNSASEVLQSIQGELAIHSYRPEEDLYLNSVLFNEGNLPLFNAFAFGSAVKIGGNSYGISCPTLKLRLNIDALPIKFPNAVSAYEEFTDQNGDVQREYMYVSGGYILFDGRHLVGDSVAAGQGYKKRTLVVYTYYPDGGPALSPGDGFETVYDANTGEKISTAAIRGTVAVGIDNCVIASDRGLPNGYALNISLIATAAEPQGSYEVTNSPGALVHITVPEGNRRLVRFTVAIPHDFDVSLAEIFAHDRKAVQSGGSGDEQFCNTSSGTLSWSKVTVGGKITTTLTATFIMEGEWSDWTIGVKASPYEAQVTPTHVPNDNGTPKG